MTKKDCNHFKRELYLEKKHSKDKTNVDTFGKKEDVVRQYQIIIPLPTKTALGHSAIDKSEQCIPQMSSIRQLVRSHL